MRSFQCGYGVGQYLLGQVRVVDGAGHGDRADQDTEGEDRLAFSNLPIGVVDEVSQHGEVFLHLVGVGVQSGGSGSVKAFAANEDGSLAPIGSSTVPDGNSQEGIAAS